jgi:hypothetical protein
VSILPRSPYRAPRDSAPFGAGYTPEPVFQALVVAAFVLAELLVAIHLERRVGVVDAHCSQITRKDGVATLGAAYCTVTTSRLRSKEIETVSIAGPQGNGVGAEVEASGQAHEVHGWLARSRGFLVGFGLEVAEGCTDGRPLSEVAAGTYLGALDAARAIASLDSTHDHDVDIHYGPWGAAPIAFLELAGVAAACALMLRRGGYRVVVSIDPVHSVVLERAVGPLRWGRVSPRGEELVLAIAERDAHGYFVALRFRSGATMRLYPWSTRRPAAHARLADRINVYLRRGAAPS